MSYQNIYDFIKDSAQPNIFSTINITITIVKNFSDEESSSKQYSIHSISVEEKENTKVASFIEDLNKNINNNQSGFKENDKGWSIFYLLKELISFFQMEKYNYYRGQSSNWETIPSVFRGEMNDDGTRYHLDFEKIYKDIQKKFPERVEYRPLPVKYNQVELQKRANQLAILQHYGVKTSLLDITYNPYIAMLFMVSGKSISNNMQLELYSIDEEKSSMFSEVEVSDFNKRITAQKGAFLNYDVLNYEDQIKGLEAIKRIVITIKYDKELSEKEMDEILQAEGYTEKEMLDERKYLEGTIVEDKVLSSVITELKRKLREFGYEQHDLFPDFEDYIKYKMLKYRIIPIL